MADSEKYFTKLVDGQLSVATVAQSGEIIPEETRPGDVYTTALVQTDDGPQLCVKTYDLNGGGGGGGTVDQTYNPTSTNAQSGTAVAEAVAPALKNKATNPSYSLMITNSDVSLTGNSSVVINPTLIANQSLSDATAVGANSSVSNYSTSVGHNSFSTTSGLAVGMRSIANSQYAIAIGTSTSYSSWAGANVDANSVRGIAIGTGANVSSAGGAIQIGEGTNSNANSFQVFAFQLLDGTTGKIPSERLPDVFANIQKAANFNVVGSISIDYDWVASNFSTSRYLIGPNNPTGAITSAQFDLKVKTPSSLSSNNFRCMLGQSAHNFYTPQIDFVGSEFHFRVSPDGESWADLTVSGEFNTSTDYYIRCIFDGTKLQAFKSANGVDYTQIGSDVACSAMYWEEQMLIGLDTDALGDRTGAWTGSIYLENLSIKINGQDYWKAVNFMNSNLTLYSGYDATKTQVLKNVNGVLTWVDEA